ncbi:Transposable element Tcb1 transposase, partial [Stegodyphus mimosarum]
MLENFVFPQLEELQPHVFLQQDGAPPHWGTIVRSSLNDHFTGRRIGRGGPIPWPPRSPDITPLNFFLWGFVKDNVYRRRVSNMDDLKARMTTAIASVDADMLAGRAEVDMPLRRVRRQYEQLSQFERGGIVGMIEAGWLARLVARQLCRSDCVVRKCWDQWTREMSRTRRPGSGRPRQTSRREDRHIVRNARVQPTASSTAIQAQVVPSLMAHLSSRTIRRRLAEGQLVSRRPLRVLPLMPTHRRLRLGGGVEHEETGLQRNGTRSSFSDESRFNLGSDDNRVRVWRARGERLNPAFAVQRHIAPTAGVMCNNRIVLTQRTHWDDFLRGRIIGRLEWGRTQLELSDELGIAQSVISRLWQQFEDDGNVSRRYSTGRPRIKTPNEDQYLVDTAKRNRRSTASDLSRQLSSATGTTISRQTVYRRSGQIRLYARRPVRCVPLTATHCRLRLAWNREHALWTPQQWACMMFSDESRFSLQSDSRRTFIRRAPGTRYHKENTIERHRYGGAGVLVWGGIILGSRTDLHVQIGTMTSQIYRDVILEQHIFCSPDEEGPVAALEID